MKNNPLQLKWITASLMGLMLCCNLYAQDTTRISIQDAEKQFLERNLQLLAQKYNIDMSRAGIIQAKLYNNPNIQLTGALYNQDAGKWFDVSSSTGQYGITVQQLIILAGKRNKQIQLAETASRQAENSFFDLMRTLRFTLRGDFYNIYFLQNSLNAYNAQITTLENLNTAYSDLYSRGIVTLKDAVRIKSLLYGLKADQTNLKNQLYDAESELQLLLRDNKTWYWPSADSTMLQPPIDKYNLSTLVDSAYANRYDLKLATENVLYNQQNYSLQKALSVPDLTLGAEFDKRGSYINNASFLHAGIDLPFFNRNQGNIKAAKIGIDQSKTQLDMQRLTVENDVLKAYSKLLATNKMLQSIDTSFPRQFQQLMNDVAENFLKKNISLLDFTDFVESYKNNVLQINQLRNDRMQAVEALNFSIGKPVIE